MTSDSIIVLSDLSRRYGRRWALIDIALEIARGETCVVAGRNGAGKTTLLRTIATAIRPDRGTITIDGLDAVRFRDDVRRRTALLSHSAYTYEPLTALENLQTFAGFLGRSAGRDALVPLLAEVGLASRADDAVSTFSAGMRRRLSLARVLLQSPKIVLLDEPYGQLDPDGFEMIDGRIRAWQQSGMTVVVATHQLERVAALGTRGFLLDGGRLVWSGESRELPSRLRAERSET